MAANVKWITFGLNEKKVKTGLHFFPYAGVISATYPAEIVLTIFSEEFETLQVSMEGARLAQPDGLILNEVFPALLGDFEGVYGISLSVNCEQHQHLNLSASVCISELICSDGTVRFQAQQVGQNSSDKNSYRGFLQDTTSLIAINTNADSKNNGLPPGLVKSGLTSSGALQATSAKELVVSNHYLQSGATNKCSFANLLVQSFELNPPEGVVYYAIDRAKNNAQPFSAKAL